MPAEAGTHDTFRRGCALGSVADVDTCVDGRLRGHDEIEELQCLSKMKMHLSKRLRRNSPCKEELLLQNARAAFLRSPEVDGVMVASKESADRLKAFDLQAAKTSKRIEELLDKNNA